MPHLLPNDIGPDMFSFVRYLIEWTVLPMGGGGGAASVYVDLFSTIKHQLLVSFSKSWSKNRKNWYLMKPLYDLKRPADDSFPITLK